MWVSVFGPTVNGTHECKGLCLLPSPGPVQPSFLGRPHSLKLQLSLSPHLPSEGHWWFRPLGLLGGRGYGAGLEKVPRNRVPGKESGGSIHIGPKAPLGRKKLREPHPTPRCRLQALQGHFRKGAGRQQEACRERGRLHCTRRKYARGLGAAASGPGKRGLGTLHGLCRAGTDF